jgi:hypothetical protein
MSMAKIKSSSSGAWVKDATRALDYLFLSPFEKIDYRVRNSITMQDWYNGFRATPLQLGEVRKCEIHAGLGITSIPYYRLLRGGKFGKPEVRRIKNSNVSFVKTEHINKLLETEAKLIPAVTLIRAIEERRFYIKQSGFLKEYRHYHRTGTINSHMVYISILDAAKIISSLMKRKTLIEKGKTLDDLNKESGWNLPQNSMHNRYRHLRREGKLHLELIGNYDSKGNLRRGKRCVIPPEVYPVILAMERETLRAITEDYTTSRVAKALGMSTGNVGLIFRAGKELGIINPYETPTFVNDGKSKLVLPINEAKKIISGEIHVPSRAFLDKFSQLKGKSEYEKFSANYARAIKQGRVVTVEMIARELHISSSHTNYLISIGCLNGHISTLIPPTEDGGRIRKHYLSASDSEWLIRNHTTLDSRRETVTYLAMTSDSGISRDFEEKIFRDIKEGKNGAFELLFAVYSNVISQLASKFVYSSTVQERKAFLATSLFEIVMDSDELPERGKVIMGLESSLMARIKEERVNYFTLDRLPLNHINSR